MKRLPIKPGLRINERGTVFDPETGETYTVNATGLTILAYLQQGLSDEEIFNNLEKEYDLNLQDCKRALMDFNTVLKMFDLLQHE